MSIFSERLKALRQANKLSQSNMATLLNISPRQYQNQEYGKNDPSYEMLLLIAKNFDISLDYLAGLTDNPKINK